MPNVSTQSYLPKHRSYTQVTQAFGVTSCTCDPPVKAVDEETWWSSTSAWVIAVPTELLRRHNSCLFNVRQHCRGPCYTRYGKAMQSTSAAVSARYELRRVERELDTRTLGSVGRSKWRRVQSALMGLWIALTSDANRTGWWSGIKTVTYSFVTPWGAKNQLSKYLKGSATDIYIILISYML